ncbi:hypothetical protein K438DRAFT_1775474 [Mycena galopus ATCC 62051]|nr:hypothetical protein K438DRAFT_1775474 [Mycena galopus ATCC 62051]
MPAKSLQSESSFEEFKISCCQRYATWDEMNVRQRAVRKEDMNRLKIYQMHARHLTHPCASPATSIEVLQTAVYTYQIVIQPDSHQEGFTSTIGTLLSHWISIPELLLSPWIDFTSFNIIIFLGFKDSDLESLPLEASFDRYYDTYLGKEATSEKQQLMPDSGYLLLLAEVDTLVLLAMDGREAGTNEMNFPTSSSAIRSGREKIVKVKQPSPKETRMGTSDEKKTELFGGCKSLQAESQGSQNVKQLRTQRLKKWQKARDNKKELILI